MATRKIVPRADNEGGLGTALKRWASAFINALTVDSATVGALSGIVKAASGVLSALALGSANLKFFMNAAGDGVEWANGFKVGTFTRDISLASGNVSYTGIGFKPSKIFFTGAVHATRIASLIGLDDGATRLCMFDRSDVAGTYAIDTAYSIWLSYGAGTDQYGYVYSFDADGFTIAWTKTGSPTGTATVYYMAFR